MNYELTSGRRVTQRKHGHLWGTDVSTLPLPRTQTTSTNRHLPPLLDSNTSLRQKKKKKQAGDVWDPNICFSLMFQLHCCSAVSSCQSFGVTPRLILPHFSEMAGRVAGVYPIIWLCRGLVFSALLLMMELGERATPTHWLIGSFAQHAGTLLVKMWWTDAYSVAFLLQISSHILLVFSFPLICLLATYMIMDTEWPFKEVL